MLYYQGLNSDVKDELSRDEKPDTLDKLAEKATRIDKRQFQRRQERKREGNPQKIVLKYLYSGNNANQGKKRDLAIYNDGKPGPMDLSTIEA
ncbi:hypothetical protein M431DRAFT_511127 [Trichoderma harzianum CBS 226.95]|uniref:Uncharacterized protein n=1 Tax=Trichoderma harzianum CBS 226.95 TaxID=983964 RepID=A0A2T4A1S0_TRIHA|nr:hypothetical protein M431DRAFT_511127 [Trichoderma harzianum CBS 226.95]PTB51012.1 hypothetical protein M431DRAFT_511127 [Trichoderma harzianum CBS 226.95]